MEGSPLCPMAMQSECVGNQKKRFKVARVSAILLEQNGINPGGAGGGDVTLDVKENGVAVFMLVHGAEVAPMGLGTFFHWGIHLLPHSFWRS